MKKEGQITIFILITILIVSIFVMFFLFKGNISLMEFTSNTVIEFPKSNSSILSDIDRIYLYNEKIIVNATFKNKIIINEIKVYIDDQNITFMNNSDNSISFFLDTSIRSKETTETKLIIMHGKTIDGRPFIDEENYQVVASTEEFLIEKTKNAEKLSKESNVFAKWALFIAIISILGNIIQFILNKKAKRKK